MNDIRVSEKDFLALLEKAFEEGWLGYRDLKESTARKIMKDYLRKNKSSKKPCYSQPAIVGDLDSPILDGAHHYAEYVTAVGPLDIDVGGEYPDSSVIIQSSSMPDAVIQNTLTTLDDTRTWVTSDP
jgi:hypothetical protein